MRYSVIVVTYNRLALLKENIEHLLNQTVKFSSILIINNASTDGTTEFLDELDMLGKITHLNTGSNLGGAGGFEYGLKHYDISSDYVLIVDDDAIIDLNFIEEIDKNIHKGIYVYSGTVYKDEAIDTSHRRNLKSKLFLSKQEVSIEKYNDKYFDYDISTFCGMLINIKILEKIGAPKGEYFIWHDDDEYSMRLLKYSRIRNINSAKLNHKVKTNTGNNISWKSFYGYRNKWDMGLTHSTHPMLFNVANYIFHITRIVKYFILAVLGSNKSYYNKLIKLHVNVIQAHINNNLGFDSRYSYTTSFIQYK